MELIHFIFYYFNIDSGISGSSKYTMMQPADAVAATNAPIAANALANNFILISPFFYNFYNSYMIHQTFYMLVVSLRNFVIIASIVTC